MSMVAARGVVRSLEHPNKLERQGIIRASELCYELAWKTLQDYLREIGYVDVAGPKPVIRYAFETGVISDGEVWAAMHRSWRGGFGGAPNVDYPAAAGAHRPNRGHDR